MERIRLVAFICWALFSIYSPPALADGGQTGAAGTTGRWKNFIADLEPSFREWKESTVSRLLAEPPANGNEAVLWHVEKNNRSLGYFVTTGDGHDLIEFSPVVPDGMLVAKKDGTYMYAGPGMHLYRPEEGESGSWINLGNGETLPPGEPVRRGPAGFRSVSRVDFRTGFPTGSQSVTGVRAEIRGNGAAGSRIQTFDTDTNAERGVEAMILHGLGKSVPYDQNRLPKNGESAGYLVFTVLDKDYYSVWAITGTVQEGEFLRVRDVFAKTGHPVYIRNDVPVNWVGSRQAGSR